MANTTSAVLTILIAWALLLLILMEVLRTRLVISGTVASPQLRPDNANLSLFMQRLARAQANCVEGLPIFGGLLIVALITDRADVTNGLAPWMLMARLVQSLVHLGSLSVIAVNVRFLAFTVQMAIAAYWCCVLLLR
jgi:uncharacterized MAPEG superfamily protein